MIAGLARIGAILGPVLAAAAVLVLAVAPMGWRFGWWHYSFAFSWLLPWSAYLAIPAMAVCAIALGLGWSALDRTRIAEAGIALLVSGATFYVPWHYNQLRTTVPRIHDITTDTENPPVYAAVLPARRAENAATVVYEGATLARQQIAAYPDLAPIIAALAPADAFKRALDAARAMPGWTIVNADPAAGLIEASDTSRWFRFTDDIVIRVAPTASGSRIDMRSVSRQGRSDFGVNAARIRSYMAALKRGI